MGCVLLASLYQAKTGLVSVLVGLSTAAVPIQAATSSSVMSAARAVGFTVTSTGVLSGLSQFTPSLAIARDRKSVVEGKGVSVRVDLGGRRVIKKKKNRNK